MNKRKLKFILKFIIIEVRNLKKKKSGCITSPSLPPFKIKTYDSYLQALQCMPWAVKFLAEERGRGGAQDQGCGLESRECGQQRG